MNDLKDFDKNIPYIKRDADTLQVYQSKTDQRTLEKRKHDKKKAELKMQLDKLSAQVLSKENLEETEEVVSDRNISARNSPRIKIDNRTSDVTEGNVFK